MFRLSRLIVCLLTSVTVVSASQRGDRSLTQEEIKAAIGHGRLAEPSPYVLRSPFPNGTTAAIVYTPFVRIAMAAREAESKGTPFDVTDVSPGDAADLVHVLVSADAVAPMGILTDADPVRVEVIERQVQRLLDSSHSRKAAWVRHDAAPVNKLPGSEHHGVIVGAFTREQLCTNCYVVAYRMRTTPEGHKETRAAWAVIKKEDVESWR